MPEKPAEGWYQAAARAMVRSGLTLAKYSVENDLGIRLSELENIQRTKLFQEVLRTERNIYYKELAIDNSLTKSALEGHLIFAITKMLENEQYDKASNAIMQYAKLKGWAADQTNVNIFDAISGGDISKLKGLVEKQLKSAKAMN